MAKLGSAASTLLSVMYRQQSMLVVEDKDTSFDTAWTSACAGTSSFVSKASRMYKGRVFSFVDTPDNAIARALSNLDSGTLDGSKAFYALVTAHDGLNRLNGLSHKSARLSVREACNRQGLQNLLLWYSGQYAKRIRQFDNGRFISRYCAMARQMIKDHLGDDSDMSELVNGPPIMARL